MSQHIMSQPLKKFWSSLERTIGLSAIPAGWQTMLGDELSRVARFLLPTQQLAGSVRCPIPYRYCIHEVILWKGEYVTSCPDGCDSVTLSRDDLVIHRIDMASLSREIVAALGLVNATAEEIPNVPGTWRIGDYVPSAGFRFPVYLAFIDRSYDFDFAVNHLSARGETFILIAPSRSHMTQPTADMLKRSKSCFLPMTEFLGQSHGDDGQLALLPGHTADALFAEFRTAHVPQPKADDGMAFFPTPADAGWSDVSIRFIDRHSVYVTAKGATGKYHCAQMGMASKKNAMPTKQWLLLEAFAEGHGLLNWQSRKADRKNQKRKDLLVADLQRFFRLDGDPFAIEGDGWRTRFTVTVRE